MPEFAALWPERFSNKTNGVAPRRWILKANPGLAGLLTRTVGDRWITDLSHAAEIEKFASDPAFQQEFRAIKRRNKVRLAQTVLHSTGISLDPDSLFDVQVKRIHEYKRQLLNVMRVIHEYLSILEHPEEQRVPRTYIFAGKSAPGYWAAKQIIKLIHNVAAVVNADPIARERMKVVFVPDYRVSLAETIIPAADLSQQISTAGMEASGTGNMKLAMNGALTLGTLDGANIEIMDAVGKPNIYTFGLSPDEVRWYREQGTAASSTASSPTASAPTSTASSAGSSTNSSTAATATSSWPTCPRTSKPAAAPKPITPTRQSGHQKRY